MKKRAVFNLTRFLLGLVILLMATSMLPAQVGPAAGPGAAPPGQLQPVHEKAAIIRLSGEVNDMMKRSLERRIDTARKAGCTLIIYEMNTYGGALTSALEISKLTKKLPEEGIRTVAWVNDKAYSAGSLISVACQQIVMVDDGTIGDCAPIAVTVDHQLVPLPAAERAKLTSPLLQEFEDSADKNHYDKTLLWAMVVPDIEISEMRNATTGETRFVDKVTKEKLLNETVAAPGGAKDRPWKFVEMVDGSNQLLTLSAKRALQMHISSATISNEDQLRTALNIRGDLMVLDSTWAENFTVEASEWLSQAWVRFALFVAMMVLAVMESAHPGSTVPGLLSVVCLVLLVGGPYLSGLAQFWEIACIVLGVAIIAVDLFFFGGIGFLAVPGFLLMAIGLVASFVPMEPGRWIPTMPGTLDALWEGMAVVVFGSMTAFGVIALLSRYMYMAPGLRRMQLSPALAGATAAGPGVGDRALRDAADKPVEEAVFVGALGLAVTDLRPSGKARFADHLVNVVSFGSFIPRATEVEVTSVGGNRVVVKPRAGLRVTPEATSAGGDAASAGDSA